jgi:hypothetical protein
MRKSSADFTATTANPGNLSNTYSATRLAGAAR